MNKRDHKLNCWEYQGCGHGPLAPGETGRPVCPAATAQALDRVHGGSNGGRACWAVDDTLCEGCEGLTAEEKYAQACRKCAHRYRVEVEEGLRLQSVEDLREIALGELPEAIGS